MKKRQKIISDSKVFTGVNIRKVTETLRMRTRSSRPALPTGDKLRARIHVPPVTLISCLVVGKFLDVPESQLHGYERVVIKPTSYRYIIIK